ncbi:MAG: glycoside hydrolase family 16 protein [Thermoanaerobaculia bacterium]|nr:glycoside hydrolase family 16 protein [Thermoanaerobaculia bacterium]
MSLSFSEMEWVVRDHEGNPGTGCWNATEESVSVDESGVVSLRLAELDGQWCQAEVASRAPARYGRHRFQVISRLDELHPSVVLGLFLYRDDEREIDIEISRAFGQKDDVGIFVVQPSDEGRSHSFPIELSGDYTTHEIDWRPGVVRFSSWHGHCDEGPCGGWIERWEYRGDRIPTESDELRVMMNLWLRDGEEPEAPQEVALRYVFDRESGITGVRD